MPKVSLRLIHLLRRYRSATSSLSSSCPYSTSDVAGSTESSSSYYSNLFSYWRSAYDRLYRKPGDSISAIKKRFIEHKMQVFIFRLIFIENPIEMKK
uniref:Uncharacterized protein n=1 Tax=Meloidogyne hapla TaxID=6305 RepID=A0A1I8BYT7_MELHA